MRLAERDLRRAAEAVVAEHGNTAVRSVERYILQLRRSNRHDLADNWQRIAGWIEALTPHAVH